MFFIYFINCELSVNFFYEKKDFIDDKLDYT